MTAIHCLESVASLTARLFSVFPTLFTSRQPLEKAVDGHSMHSSTVFERSRLRVSTTLQDPLEYQAFQTDLGLPLHTPEHTPASLVYQDGTF